MENKALLEELYNKEAFRKKEKPSNEAGFKRPTGPSKMKLNRRENNTQ